MRREGTEKIKDLLFVLTFLFVILFIIFVIVNTFFVNSVTFDVSLDSKTFSRGDNVTISLKVRDLGFFKIRGVLIESYAVELDSEGNVLGGPREKRNSMYLQEVKGLSSKIVDYDFNTEDLEAGAYRVFTHFTYRDKIEILSKDLEIK